MEIALGLAVEPDQAFLERVWPVVEECADYLEIVPETLWDPGPEPSPAHALFEEIRRGTGLPFAAHGVGLSLGSVGTDARTDAWLRRVAADHTVFDFLWYSEHLGFTEADGLQAVLPLPLPLNDAAVAAVAERLRRMRACVPVVAFENSVFYFGLGDPAREPEFFTAICDAADCGFVLDLHNVFTHCVNFGLDADAYVARLPLDRVIEIHLSGGSESAAAWLDSGRVFRLDSHDGPIPEAVWSLFERVRPLCAGLRGVVVERQPGGLGDEDVPAFAAEVRRLRGLLC